jgi:hypothetical protein
MTLFSRARNLPVITRKNHDLDDIKIDNEHDLGAAYMLGGVPDRVGAGATDDSGPMDALEAWHPFEK